MPDSRWRLRAACAGTDTERFFPPPEQGRRRIVPPELVRLCGGCPVRTACLDEAIQTGADGVWGGTSETDRRAILRRIRRRYCPHCQSAEITETAAAVCTQTCTACGISWQATTVPAPSRSRRPNLGVRRRRAA